MLNVGILNAYLCGKVGIFAVLQESDKKKKTPLYHFL